MAIFLAFVALVSAVVASAAALDMDGGVLQVFTFDVEVDAPEVEEAPDVQTTKEVPGATASTDHGSTEDSLSTDTTTEEPKGPTAETTEESVPQDPAEQEA